MIALHYLVDALLTIYLYVLILRFVMQLVRADFRNQIAHAVLIVTNPLIMPLRKILPPVGKVDTSSVIAILIVAALIVAAAPLILQGPALDPITWIRWTLLLIARSFSTVNCGLGLKPNSIAVRCLMGAFCGARRRARHWPKVQFPAAGICPGGEQDWRFRKRRQ